LTLQRAAEALAGVPLHKQNFRRLVEQGGLVEGTGQLVISTPAAARPSSSASGTRCYGNARLQGSVSPVSTADAVVDIGYSHC